MSEFASRWPDVRLSTIDRLKTALVEPPKVSAERDEELLAQIVVSVTPAQMATVISRIFMVTVECWATDKVAAFDLCSEAAYVIESSPRRNGVVNAELNSGPNDHRDEAGAYYYDATVMVTMRRLPNA